ncbi:hypothetical protein [Paenarthrobacter aurescens]|nr:hypothetical protein [Paenarthrobacter aurescens]MCT9872078.1 hypothetical protein [Paenarthrobacter aurescens]
MRLEGWHVLVFLALLVAVVVVIAVVLLVGLLLRNTGKKDNGQGPGTFR